MTKRAGAHCNDVKASGRAFLTKVNKSLLHVSLNGNGTPFYDPRTTVSVFLKRMQRHNAQLTVEICREIDFAKNLFTNGNGHCD